jgi:hypothetical protein
MRSCVAEEGETRGVLLGAMQPVSTRASGKTTRLFGCPLGFRIICSLNRILRTYGRNPMCRILVVEEINRHWPQVQILGSYG